MAQWTAADIPDQTGRTMVVTGANSGLGYETTLALARKHAHVIMACRNMEKGQAARDEILRQVPDAALEVQRLDLADLALVHEFADAFKAQHQQLDVLFNNAGIMAPPRRETRDGFELQLGINHLGHFALAGLLLEVLLNTPGSRVVTTSSGAHVLGTINFSDLQSERQYNRWAGYAQSKLANLLFAFELQRKLSAVDAPTISVAAHPGYAATEAQSSTSGDGGQDISSLVLQLGNTFLAQSAAMGALPQLYAGTSPGVEGGTYYGPGFLFLRGFPQQQSPAHLAYDTVLARQLWEVSEELTDVRYTALEQPAAAQV